MGWHQKQTVCKRPADSLWPIGCWYWWPIVSAVPAAEHALAQWLESDFVCGRDGKRILARWKQQGRVRVDLNWLQEWYRTLDQLLAHKERIEVELFARLRDLFHLQVEMVFYDLTSTYFEGSGPAGLANFGYSRDGKARNRQVQVGLVMINGWPIAHHVFDGSLRDSATVEMVLKDLQERFGLQRVIFVGDRGMVTIQNLALLRQRGQGYIVGLKRRRNEQVNRYIQAAAQGPWQECPVGITALEREKVPRTMVTEVAGEEPGVRVFVVQSEERLAYERGMREAAMEKTRQALEKLSVRVAAGRLKKAQKIGEAAARILGRNHGSRYYGWSFEKGIFRYFEHPGNLAPEKALEGKYVIQTEELDLSALQAVEAYKDLTEIERSFRSSKISSRCAPSTIGDPNGCGHTFSSQPWPSCWLVRWRRNSRPPRCRCPAPRHWKPCAPCTSLTSESVQRSDAE